MVNVKNGGILKLGFQKYSNVRPQQEEESDIARKTYFKARNNLNLSSHPNNNHSEKKMNKNESESSLLQV